MTIKPLVELNPPTGYKCYGANQEYEPSAEIEDGQPVHWFAQCGTGPHGFGDYVFRQVGNNRATYVWYKDDDVMNGRGELEVRNGVLYLTGNEDDAHKTATVYLVPGFVPFTNGGEDWASVAGLLQRLATLELKAANMSVGSTVDSRVDGLLERVKSGENVAAKANERALNALNQVGELKTRPAGISRDEAWQLAADRQYAEIITPGTGVRAELEALVKSCAGGIDQPARDIANEALRLAGEGRTVALQAQAGLTERPTFNDVAELIRKWFDAQWQAWVSYADHRLFNIVWDRSVRLLRYKESKGLTAAELPVNDEHSLAI